MVLVLVAAQMLPKWVWAQPLEPVTRGDLAGYSKKQIVEMGQDKWGDIAYEHYLSGADRDTLIFARCAYDLNAPLIRTHQTIGRLRTDLWLMADASIALYGIATARERPPSTCRVMLAPTSRSSPTIFSPVPRR